MYFGVQTRFLLGQGLAFDRSLDDLQPGHFHIGSLDNGHSVDKFDVARRRFHEVCGHPYRLLGDLAGNFMGCRASLSDRTRSRGAKAIRSGRRVTLVYPDEVQR